MAPHILNLGARGAGGHFTPGNEPRYPLHRRLGGPQGGSGRFAEENALECGSRPPQNPKEHNFVTEDKQRHDSEQRHKNVHTVLSGNK